MRKLKNEELKRLSLEEYRNKEKHPVVVVLDNIRSLNNIGSIFRTADAFRIEKLHLCGITACPPHRDIQKTALGATESVAWQYFEKTASSIELLRKNNFTIYSIEQAEGSISLENFDMKKIRKVALVFGHEVKGIQQAIIDLSDACIEIPQFGTKHSFNITVSAGIVLWEFLKKIKQL
ncbi:MAG: RNA methyltransferase [Bacteroidales bacterium]|nr:RNA methyltransferase [Bacteroidales bacterium]MCF8344495.1 RNA methyltransferase [Bacteroidales bacterium]MCF8350998.1 RNA methyltransferase [Bacteroidales bacterium]MCF8376122.1 RNA methyltransferase [Bacteroidales bacterium]MCF8401435.1 RNA methyltransferase [Bacteroidales bacterium]